MLIKRPFTVCPMTGKSGGRNVAKTQENVPVAAIAEEQLGGTYFLYRPVFSLNCPSERLSYHALIYLRKD